MHLTKGHNTTTDFSQLLADAANIKSGHKVLVSNTVMVTPLLQSGYFMRLTLIKDLFFGLGYCTQAALNKGAKQVVSFEMYEEVVQLAKKNPFSPGKVLGWSRVGWLLVG